MARVKKLRQKIDEMCYPAFTQCLLFLVAILRVPCGYFNLPAWHAKDITRYFEVSVNLFFLMFSHVRSTNYMSYAAMTKK